MSAIRPGTAGVTAVTAAAVIAATWLASTPATTRERSQPQIAQNTGAVQASTQPRTSAADAQLCARRTAGHADMGGSHGWLRADSAIVENAAEQSQWVEYGSADYRLCVRTVTRAA